MRGSEEAAEEEWPATEDEGLEAAEEEWPAVEDEGLEAAVAASIAARAAVGGPSAGRPWARRRRSGDNRAWSLALKRACERPLRRRRRRGCLPGKKMRRSGKKMRRSGSTRALSVASQQGRGAAPSAGGVGRGGPPAAEPAEEGTSLGESGGQDVQQTAGGSGYCGDAHDS